MGRAEVLQALRAIAAEAEDAEALFERSVRASAQGVHAAALAEFGTWEAALAHLLVEYAQRGSRRGAASASAPLQQAPATRRVTEAAELPLYLLSEEGYLSSIPFNDLPAGDAPAWQYLPDGPGKEAWPDRLHPSADDDSTFFALAANGTGSSLHRPHFAPWSEHARPARFVDHVLRAEDSPVVGMFPRRELRLAKRIYAVATDGQIKASEAEEYAKRVSNEAIDVIIPRDGARAYTMFSGHEDAQVFLASSGGKAIVFDASEIRSQGLRAQGVRGIQLDDDHTLVGAFAIEEPEVVLVTAHGYVKRMLLDEFRPQGRGGAGLQTCKLADDDRVVAMVQTTINDDLLLIATDGQYLRLPIWQIPSMGRPARGDRMVAPPDGHMILDACIVPAGTEA